MSFLSFIFTSLGSIALCYAAWMGNQVKIAKSNQMYIFCGVGFVFILLGQLITLKLTPALIAGGRKEPTFAQKSSLHEFRRHNARQGQYHKRAQAAAAAK
jgi:hypothetical protein